MNQTDQFNVKCGDLPPDFVMTKETYLLFSDVKISACKTTNFNLCFTATAAVFMLSGWKPKNCCPYQT